MKQAILKSLLLLILLSLSLFANIDTEIEAIQKAPVEERFKLMNAFKRKMVQMQEQERMKAIRKLRFITKSKHSSKILKVLTKKGKHDLSKLRTYEREESKTHMISNTAHEEQSENATEDQVENEMQDQIEDETEDQIEDQIEDGTEDQIEDDIEDQIEDENDDDD